MSKRWRKLSIIHVQGEEGSPCSKAAKKGNFLKPCPSWRGALKADRNIPETCTSHMQPMSPTNAESKLQQPFISPSIESQWKMWESRFTATDGPPRKRHLSISQLPYLTGPEAQVNLSNEEECGIEGYNIIAAPKYVDRNSISNIATTMRQRARTYKETLSTDVLKH